MATKLKPHPLSAIRDMQKEMQDDTIVRLVAQYKWITLRYLFDGGAVCDVVAVRDDSDLRAWVLAATGYPGIVGCTIVEGSDE